MRKYKFALTYIMILLILTFTFVSCNSSVSKTVPENNNAVLKIFVENANRTVFPETIDLNEFTDIDFRVINARTWNELYYIHYDSLQELQEDSLTIAEEDLGEYDLTLQAWTNSLYYTASARKYIQSGENEINFNLRLQSLGHGNGNIDISFDFSQANYYEYVDHADILLYPFSHNLNDFDETVAYSARIYDKELDDEKICQFSVQDIPSKCYRAVLCFYATSNENVLMLKYPFVIQVADNLTSRDSITITELNPVYNINFVMNDNDDPSLVFDYDANSKITRLTTKRLAEPTRDDFVFRGWYWDELCLNPFILQDTQIRSDITLYADWQSNFTSDGSYFATQDTVYDIICGITEGSLEQPTIIRMLGALDGDVIDDIRNALQANPDVFFEIDFTTATTINHVKEYNNFNNCRNLVNISLSNNFQAEWTVNPFRGCSALKNIIWDSNYNYSVKDGILYNRKSLLTYPAGREEDVFEIPEGIEICGYAFSGSSLKTIVISEMIDRSYIDENAFAECKQLEEINVHINNMSYSSIEGILYSRDGTQLIYYPGGKQTTSFEIPNEVETICRGAFADANNLTEVVFPRDNSWWYQNEYTSESYVELINSGAAITVTDVSKNAETLKKYSYDYYQKLDISKLIVNGSDLTVYDDIEYDVSDSSYTIGYSDTDQSNFRLYRIPTAMGKNYVLTTDNEVMNDDHYYHYEGYIGKTNYTILSQEGARLDYEYEKGMLFQAISEYTYVLVQAYSTSWIIRVWKPSVTTKNLALSYQNKEDITLNYNDGSLWGDTSYYYVNTQDLPGNYRISLVSWYVDGLLVSSSDEYDAGRSFYLYESEYSKGVHLITVELTVTRGEDPTPYYYSSSKQIVID